MVNETSIFDSLDLSRLTEFPYSKGGEGRFYAINDKIGLKEYIDKQTGFDYSTDFKRLFDLYCRENNILRDLGIILPEFYEWKIVKDMENPDVSRHARFYIAQERIHDRELFSADPFSFFKNVYSDKISSNRKYKFGSDEDRLISYVDDFILMNTCIEAMPKKTLEKFIMDAFNIYDLAEYSVPDVSGQNVFAKTKVSKTGEIMGIDKLTHIDLFFVNKESDRRFNSTCNEERIQKIYDNIVADMLRLFKDNDLNDLWKNETYVRLRRYDKKFNASIEKRLENHTRLCEAALKKVIRTMNGCLDNPKIKNKALFKNVTERLKNLFGEDEIGKVLEDVHGAELLM